MRSLYSGGEWGYGKVLNPVCLNGGVHPILWDKSGTNEQNNQKLDES